MSDFQFENHGSICLLRPLNDEFREHIRDNVGDEAQFIGDALAVEPRYVQPLIEQLADNGFYCQLNG